MKFLARTTDKFQVVTSAAVNVDVTIDYADLTKATGVVIDTDRQPTQISTATTTDVLAAPGASTTMRMMKGGTFRNRDTVNATDLTFQLNASGTIYEIHKVTLQAGDMLEYIDGLGWFVTRKNTATSGLKNVSTADQSMTAATATYITGSSILLPSGTALVAGMVLRWTLQFDKTAAGTATSSFDLRTGVNQSTADASRCATGALDTETAAADEMFAVVLATIRGPIGASCIIQSSWMFNDNLTTTGFSTTARKAQVKRVQSAAFDITPAGTFAGLSMTSGTADVVTMRQVTAELLYTGG